MSERNILPCPFCGEYAEFVHMSTTKNIKLGFIRCTGCGLKTNQDNCTKDFAIDKWNTRNPIEKVVEQLENLEPFHVDGYGDDFVNLYDAIEIVKQGGVSDDVCQWVSVSDGEFIQNPHTKRLNSNEPSMKNVYCNTCGKKIKVVE